MTYKCELLPDEPILLVTMSPEYSLAKDGSSADADAKAILEKSEEPLFLILDLSLVSFSLDDVVYGANQGARGEKPLFHHPKVRETVFVTSNPMMKLSVKGMAHPVFGSARLCARDTAEKALSYIRSQLQ